MFKRIGRFSYERRRLVLVGWVLLLVGLLMLGQVAGGEFRTEFRLPGSESQEAFDLLRTKGYETRSGESARIVFKADGGVRQPQVQQTMESFFAKVLAGVEDSSIVSPYTPEGARQISSDGTIAYAELNLADRRFEDYIPVAETVRDLRDQIDQPGLAVELGSDIFIQQENSPSEAIGVLAAVVILLISFGSLLAMGLPILAALFGIGCGIALGELVANFLKVPSFAPLITAMVGIGVGIDYALFIVTRYRQGIGEGMTPQQAVERALDTSGRAVLFAAITVVISLFGIFAMDLDVMRALAVAASLGVLMTMLSAMTLLPAVLGFVGHNLDRFGLPHRSSADKGNVRHSFWYRWSRVIQAHPWPALIAGLSLLVLLALPVFSIRFGFADAGNRSTADTTRRAYDLLGEAFGPGFNGPFLLVANATSGSLDDAALQRLQSQLGSTEGVSFVSPLIPNDKGDAAILQVYPTTSPQDEATSQLVTRLRKQVVPAAMSGSSTEVKVGGLPPGAQDFADYTLGRLPLVMGSVLVLSFLLLMAVFRSLIVPLKAVVMNLLSIGAAYGIVVMVFQWGWARQVIGVSKEGPIEAWVPLMLYAIVFGLSMDYEVFLLSRIREEYDKHRDNGLAVADGLAATARVITAAAAIMVCVFLSFVLQDDRAIKLFGLGLAVAVFIDATIVRMVLVPSAMELLGDANWWLPRWLDRLLPQIHVDSSEPEPEPLTAAAR